MLGLVVEKELVDSIDGGLADVRISAVVCDLVVTREDFDWIDDVEPANVASELAEKVPGLGLVVTEIRVNSGLRQ